jgi:hypothetical protein
LPTTENYDLRHFRVFDFSTDNNSIFFISKSSISTYVLATNETSPPKPAQPFFNVAKSESLTQVLSPNDSPMNSGSNYNNFQQSGGNNYKNNGSFHESPGQNNFYNNNNNNNNNKQNYQNFAQKKAGNFTPNNRANNNNNNNNNNNWKGNSMNKNGPT